MYFNNYKKLKGDASLRKYFRDKKSNSIIVYAKKDKKINLLIYASINKLLSKNKIYTPNLICENYKKNYIKIQDLGDVTGVKKFKKFNISNYLKLIDILQRLKKIKTKKIKTFLNTSYKIPKYTNQLLVDEARLFTKWYLPTKIKKNRKKISIEFLNILKKLTLQLELKKDVFVHRDFHISNIMILNTKFYLIDSQDAVYGNETYDLASLVDDVRLKLSLENREKIYNSFIIKNKKIDNLKFRNDFEVLSVIRNLKIIGIFTRLFKRDKKKSYIKMIPDAWSIIDERRKYNKKFNDLNIFLDKYFPKEIRKKK